MGKKQLLHEQLLLSMRSIDVIRLQKGASVVNYAGEGLLCIITEDERGPYDRVVNVKDYDRISKTLCLSLAYRNVFIKI